MKLLMSVFLLSVGVAFAEGEKPNQPSIETQKAKILEGIEKRAKVLNDFKSCVTAASSREALKTCRESHRKANEEFRNDMKERRQQRKAKRNSEE